MPPRDRRPASNPEPTEDIPFKFDAARFATLAVQKRIDLPSDKAQYRSQQRAGENRASRLLYKNGYAYRGDSEAAAKDVMMELVRKLREVEQKARTAWRVDHLPMAMLLDRLNERLTATPAGGDSSAPFALTAARAVSERLLVVPPQQFAEDVYPWSSTRLAALLVSAQRRIATYTITVLKNECISVIRDAENSRTHAADHDDAQAHEAAEVDSPHNVYFGPSGSHWLTYQYRKGGNVLSSHLRAVIVLACEKARKRLVEEEPDPQRKRSVNALIDALATLLEVPESNLYTLAREALEADGHKDTEVRRLLALAFRHPVFVDAIRAIDFGRTWK